MRRPETAEELREAIAEAVKQRKIRREKLHRGFTASSEPAEKERTRWTDADLDDLFLLLDGMGLVLAGLSTRITDLEAAA